MVKEIFNTLIPNIKVNKESVHMTGYVLDLFIEETFQRSLKVCMKECSSSEEKVLTAEHLKTVSPGLLLDFS